MQLCKEEQCYGCYACVDSCPKKCLTMKENRYGHIIPVCDENQCIDCGLCEKSCPVLDGKEKEELKEVHKVYAAWAKDENIRMTSSSGGMAYVIEKSFLKQGGIVYGAELTDEIFVRHIRVTDIKELYRLQGSKYVQSHIGDNYISVKKDLMNGKKVLFTGTPCQIAGLKTYLKEKAKDENLYTMDLVCHGVPSQTVFKKYIYKESDGKKIQNIRFRDETGYGLQLDLEEGIKRIRMRDSYWFRGFMYGIFNRESCYQCPYAGINRIGDISLGDFWGLGEKIPFNEKIINNKVSLVLENTDKGTNIVRNVNEAVHIFERTMEEAVEGNAQLRTPVAKSKKYKCFKKLVPFMGVMNALRLCYPRLFIKRLLKIVRR